MKRVLIISPHFPPVNAPDCQRVRMSLPYYRQFGWEAEVVAVEPQHRPDWLDPTLLETVPAEVPVHRCGAWPRRLTRLAGVQNLGLRCAPFLHRVAAGLLRSRRFDLVFFSTTQFLVTPAGLRWRRNFGVPYVIDLQDPWRSNFYERPGAPRPPGGWKYQFARLTAWWNEERTFRGAAGFMSVSPHYFHELRARYDWFARRPQALIPFGGPQADFAHIRGRPQPRPAALPADGRRHWVAAGSLGPAFGHSLRVLFSGLRRLREAEPAAADRLRLHFIGTSHAPREALEPAARPVAEAYGVADLIAEQPGRIGYLDSLRLIEAADGLLLLGSDDLGYSPSKVYPYFMTGRPLLALARHGSLLAELLERLQGAELVILQQPGRLDAPPREVAACLARAASAAGPARVPRNEVWFDENFTAEAGARRQCQFFDAVVAASA